MGLLKLAIERQEKKLVSFNGSNTSVPPLYQTNTQRFRIQVVDATGDPAVPYEAVDCTGLQLRAVIVTGLTGGDDTLLTGALEAAWSYDTENHWFTGEINLNTVEVEAFLEQVPFKTAFLEINLMDGGTPTTIFGSRLGTENITLNSNGDDLQATVPAPSDTYLTDAQTEALWLYGNGSPEGVKTAGPGRTYWDQTAKSLWIKDTGVGNTGWHQLVG